MEQTNYSIKFYGIEIVEKFLSKPINIGIPSQIDEFIFNIGVKVTTDPNSELIVIYINVNITKDGEEGLLGAISVGCSFKIEHFNQFILANEEGILTIPEKLEIPLRAMSLSTARGVLFSEFKGTFLHNAILPIVLFMDKSEEKLEPVVK
jgi:hypothetical protein